MPTEKPRVSITLDEEMLKRIDDFRFANRIGSRSQALNELIKLGIEQLNKEKEEGES